MAWHSSSRAGRQGSLLEPGVLLDLGNGAALHVGRGQGEETVNTCTLSSMCSGAARRSAEPCRAAQPCMPLCSISPLCSTSPPSCRPRGSPAHRCVVGREHAGDQVFALLAHWLPAQQSHKVKVGTVHALQRCTAVACKQLPLSSGGANPPHIHIMSELMCLPPIGGAQGVSDMMCIWHRHSSQLPIESAKRGLQAHQAGKLKSPAIMRRSIWGADGWGGRAGGWGGGWGRASMHPWAWPV